MGTGPPELDILEIGEVSMDRFRGIFKLAYSGDGYLVLETKVQVITYFIFYIMIII